MELLESGRCAGVITVSDIEHCELVFSRDLDLNKMPQHQPPDGPRATSRLSLGITYITNIKLWSWKYLK